MRTHILAPREADIQIITSHPPHTSTGVRLMSACAQAMQPVITRHTYVVRHVKESIVIIPVIISTRDMITESLKRSCLWCSISSITCNMLTS